MSTHTEVSRTQRLERTAQRVMDSLDRQDERLNQHYSVQRKHARHELRTTGVVVLPAIPKPVKAAAEKAEAEEQSAPAAEPEQLQVWIRNISPTGLSFVYPQEFPHKKMVVGINPNPGSTAWFHADVMRVRKVIEGFWEYGLAFRERATP